MTSETLQDRELRLLVDIFREVGHHPDPWSRLPRLVELAAAAVGARTGSLFVLGDTPPRLYARVVRGQPVASQRQFALAVGEAIPGWVVEHDESLRLDHPRDDARFQRFPLSRADDDAGADPFASTRADDALPENLVCVPLGDENGVFGALELIDRDGGFTSAEEQVLVDFAAEVSVILRKATLVRELEREQLLHRQLLDINKILLSSLNLREVLWRIVEAVGRVIDFEAVGIFLSRDGTVVEELVERGYDPDSLGKLHEKVGAGLVGHAVSIAEPVYVADVSLDPRYVNARSETRSELVAPMVSKGRVIGAFNVESDRLDAYGDEDLERMVAFADQAAVAVESARLYERSVVAEKYEEELSIARDIQLFFLPQRAPEIPGVDLAGVNIPSQEVGGDYYDFISVAPGHLGLAIGDVSGKGVSAGMIMASFRASLLAEIRNNYAIPSVMSKVNQLLCESTETHRFVTALYGVYDLSTRRFTYASAGHTPALLVRKNGEVEELKEGGLVLGVLPNAIYEQGVRHLEVGDILVFYTDGVTEAVNADDELYGVERLAALILERRGLSASQLAREVEAHVREFAGDVGVGDDLTLMIVRVSDE